MDEHSTCTVGIDLGDRRSLACVYAGSAVVEWFEFGMTHAAVREAFAGKGYGKVAMEAGAQSGWVTHELRRLGYDPLVANPRKLKAISANVRKSDRNDALLLAKLAAVDASLLHPTHPRSEARALALTVLRARDCLVRGRTRLVNAIRGLCKGVGVRLKSGSADGFVNREPDVPTELAPATAGMFVAIRAMNEQIKVYDDQLEVMLETTFPEARRVKQVRGVGPVTALAFVLTLEDPSRFPDGRTAAAYLGLVPRRDQSGAIDKQLGISKTGNTFVRRLLAQCAHYILGPFGQDCDLRRWGLALMARGGKSAKKRAIVATARKLAVLLFRLWKRDEDWKPLFNAESHSVASASDAVRPQPAVAADCANFLDETGNRERRRIDCSAADSSDPSMHRTPSGPSTSADRSMGHGTTSPATKVPARASRLQRPHLATADGDRGGPPAERPRAARAQIGVGPQPPRATRTPLRKKTDRSA